ncbi:MAG: 50S ribosomal protein L5 [Verrucomicrobiaceae bacterium]
MQPELLTQYTTKIIPELRAQLGLKNIHQVPRLEKIVINCSVGSQADRKQAVEDASRDVGLITGQKAMVTFSKKAISNFKLREGEPIGLKVTLRGPRMYDFLMRLVKTALPRVRDFRGVTPRAFDGRGNYTLGISDQSIFPEIELDKIKRSLGFDVTFVTSASSDDHARELLRALGMPFRKPAAAQQKKAGEQPDQAAA